MTLAAETRTAIRERPFLLDALRAGVVNYAAVARQLDVGEDVDAVAAALRRFEDRLPPMATEARAARVRMQSGLRPTTEAPVLSVGDHGYAIDGGEYTGIVATGAVDPHVLAHALALFRTHDVDVTAAGVAGGSLVLVVPERAGGTAVRLLETALDAVPA